MGATFHSPARIWAVSGQEILHLAGLDFPLPDASLLEQFLTARSSNPAESLVRKFTAPSLKISARGPVSGRVTCTSFCSGVSGFGLLFEEVYSYACLSYVLVLCVCLARSDLNPREEITPNGKQYHANRAEDHNIMEEAEVREADQSTA